MDATALVTQEDLSSTGGKTIPYPKNFWTFVPL
jgi:hypothetical protein